MSLDGPRAEKSVMPCLQGLLESVVHGLQPIAYGLQPIVYGLQPIQVHFATGQMLPLKAVQLTTRTTPLDRLTCEQDICTLRFLVSFELGSREESRCGCPGREISRFPKNPFENLLHCSRLNRRSCY